MATEIQYKFFEKLYDQENTRYGELETRAEFYLSVITIFLGVLAFKTEDIGKLAKLFDVPVGILLLSALPFVVALFCVVFATSIRGYESAADPEDLVDAPLPADDEFREDRMADFTVAVGRNSAANDNVASWLTASSIALTVGVVAQLLLMGYAALR